MTNLDLIFGIVGGLGLFILGIKIMSDGLRKAAGNKMRQILKYLTDNRFSGLFLGTIVTSVIQSSSATIVMLVGFVNAGLMTLVQAIPVILGANIGTTITAQLIAFKLTDYALPIVAVGAFMYMFGKRKMTRQIGEAILGFGILFLGLKIMTDAVKVLGTGSKIHELFARFSKNIFLGVLVGAIVTGIIQSSSVTTGIIIVMANIGLLDLRGAIPLVFGANIGTCVTALIASLGTNITAKRTAVAHIVQKTTGTVIALAMFPFYLYIIPMTSGNLARQVANSHTLFNVITSFLFIGFVPLYAKLIEKLVPGEEVAVEYGPKYLAKNLLDTPSIALEAARKETIRMTKFANEMVETAMDAFNTGSRKDIENVFAKEDIVDELRDAIASYIIRITEREISEEEARMVPSMLHSINDIERIGDHAENMAKVAERILDRKVEIPQEDLDNISTMYAIVKDMMQKVMTALLSMDKEAAQEILRKERELNTRFIDFREKHVNRMDLHKYQSYASIFFTDMLANLEKIGDHITNIAQAIMGRFEWNHDDVN